MSPTPRSPVQPEVGIELERVVHRWRQLPLDHALSYADRVHALIQSLADQVAQATAVPPSAVPDCGPATLMDQLTVLIYDVTTANALPPTLAQTLAALRRDLL